MERVLNTYSTTYQPDRLHFHLDKDVYASSDTVWFKSYSMAGFKISDGSKNLYVDWIDDHAKILAHQVFPISSSGASCGLFVIPETFAGNVLHLHAYTKWMLNFDSGFLYNRDIRIVRQRNFFANPPTKVSTPAGRRNSSGTSSFSPTAVPINPTLSFFPQGGNMVAGLGNKIAFLCCDQWGRPVTISGEIKDSKGNKITDIQTKHDGMGDVGLLPSEGEAYTADWKDEQGNTHQTTLPTVLREGIVMDVQDKNDNKKFVLQRSND